MMQSEDAQTTFSFLISAPPGSLLEPRPDGSVAVVTETPLAGTGAVLVTEIGSVDAPWAYDADGNSVATEYVIDGMTLRQVVNPNDSTAYPVIADPKFSVGWSGLFVRWTRGEAKWLNGLSWVMLAAAVGTACTGPHIALCAAAVAGLGCVLFSLSDWAIDKLYDRGCRVETRILPWTSTYTKC
jgi:hypothetical protein